MANEKYLFEKDEMLIELVKCKPGLYDLHSPFYSNNKYKKSAWAKIERALDMPGAKNRWEQLRSQYRKFLRKKRIKSAQQGARHPKWRFSNHMTFLNAYTYTSSIDTQIKASVQNNKSDDANIDNVQEISDIITLKTEIIDNIEVEEVSDSALTLTSAPPIPSDFLTTLVTTPTATVPSESVTNLTSTSTVSKRNRRENPPESSSTLNLMKYNLQPRNEEHLIHPMDIFFQLMATTVKNFSPNDQHYVKTKVFKLVSQIEEKYLTPATSTFLPGIHRSLVSPDPNSQSAMSSNSFLENASFCSSSISRDCSTSFQQ